MLRLLDTAGIQSIEEFDERFRGTQSLSNWIQDLESELWNAGLDERQFLSARIAMCEEAMRRFPSDDGLMVENRRRALAESYFELDETDKAESLYREWLDADPCWGWGWIGWSDCYRFTRTERVELNRCEQILREGFAIADVRDRADIADRLADVCEEQERDEEAKEFRRQSERRDTTIEVSRTVSSAGKVLRQKTGVNFGGAGLPLSELSNVPAMLRETPSMPVTRQKVRRNEPCPCGSGKEIQKVLRYLTRGLPGRVRHTDLCRPRAHPSRPDELNLGKAVRHGGKNRGGLQDGREAQRSCTRSSYDGGRA